MPQSRSARFRHVIISLNHSVERQSPSAKPLCTFFFPKFTFFHPRAGIFFASFSPGNSPFVSPGVSILKLYLQFLYRSTAYRSRRLVCRCVCESFLSSVSPSNTQRAPLPSLPEFRCSPAPLISSLLALPAPPLSIFPGHRLALGPAVVFLADIYFTFRNPMLPPLFPAKREPLIIVLRLLAERLFFFPRFLACPSPLGELRFSPCRLCSVRRAFSQLIAFFAASGFFFLAVDLDCFPPYVASPSSLLAAILLPLQRTPLSGRPVSFAGALRLDSTAQPFLSRQASFPTLSLF